MLTLKLKKRRFLLISLSVALFIFCSCLGGIFYASNQASVRALQRADLHHKELDKQIAAAKAKKRAEAQAKEAQLAKTAAADAALEAQQHGHVIAPAGCAATGAHSDPSSIDVVINKKRCFSPIDFTPTDLVGFNGFLVSAKIVPDLTAMFNAAAAAGLPLSMTSSYRSYSNQVVTYNNWVRVNGSTAAADTVSARPGYSEHQTGFVFDLSAGNCTLECFRSSAHYSWMLAHAHDYGFIERYPTGHEAITGYSPEAWHWRYVGVPTAQSMKRSGIKTLEQLWGVPGGSY